MKMGVRSKFIFNMNKIKNIFIFTSLFALISCSTEKDLSSNIFCFDTVVSTHLYDGENKDLKNVEDIFKKISKLSDNYSSSDVTNIYTINHSNDIFEVDHHLYDLMKQSILMSIRTNKLFNPLVGSLAKAWKDALSENKVLSESEIETELNKIKNSNVSIPDVDKIKRIGEAEIDLGGIAKGYALDIAKEYLLKNNISHYLIDAGRSSILLGEKYSSDKLFNIGISDISSNAYLKLNNCFLSTSSISEQGVTIDGVTYSHIINPITGSAINVNDAVVVISDLGYVGDALSTTLMMVEPEQFIDYEKTFEVKIIAISNHEITYKSKGIEVYYH